MGQQVRRRFQKSVQFVANNKVNEDLSRGMIYRELALRLTGAATTTGVNNTGANTLKGDEWGVVKRIDVIANNTDVIKSISGVELWWLNFFWYGARPQVTAAIGDGATANPPFESVLILPFWMPQSVRPIDTALDSRELSDLKIEVTWGTFTDINSAATAFTTAPQLHVSSVESFGVAGPFAQWRTYEIQQQITATNPRLQIQLPVGPIYRGFYVNFTDANVDSGAILNNFKVVSGTTVFADVREEDLRQVQAIRTNLQRDFGPTGATGAYLPFLRGNANNYMGHYYYDHCMDGFLSEGIDTLGFSEFTLELDVAVGGGTTRVFVLPQQIIPVRGTAKAA